MYCVTLDTLIRRKKGIANVREQLKQGFSLMEMMVVLLIVAIIAAATAPMVTKKMSRNAGTGDSPWVFTGLNNSIAYNMNGSDASAIIGTSRYNRGNNGPQYPRLVLASGNDGQHPAFAFADANGNFSGQINMNQASGIVTLNNAAVGNNSTAIGMGQTIENSPSGIVAIGQGLGVEDDHPIDRALIGDVGDLDPGLDTDPFLFHIQLRQLGGGEGDVGF